MKRWWRNAFVLVLLVALAGCSKKSEEPAAAGTSSAQAQAELAASSSEAQAGSTDARSLVPLVDLIVAEAADLPRAEFDPAALAKQLGKDPQAQFEWVRDRSWWAPYRGLLRGSQGVMLDRVGSNLDRAVLLGDLLRHAGYTVRLAHAQLPESLARTLLGKVRAIPDQRRPVSTTKPLSDDRKRLLDSAAPDYEQSEQQRMADEQRLEDEAKTLVRSQADRLQAATRDIASSAAPAGDATALAAMRDHWWVERKDGNDWIAMDVLLPDAKVGDALVAASTTSEWKSGDAAPSISAGDWHTVQVQVVIERYEGSATTESTVLDATLRPAEVLNRPIRLRHFPKQWPDKLPGPDKDPNALGNAAVNVREWVPYLQVGDRFVSQSGFTDRGDRIADPLNPKRDIAGAGGAGFMSGFGEALGGGDAGASSLSAEWIDYEIRVPGEPVQKIRRRVFDLMGPARRLAKTEGFDPDANDALIARSEALLGQIDMFLQPCEIPAEFASYLVSESIVANQEAIRDLAAERNPTKARDLARALFAKLDVWSPLPQLARWRSELADRPVGWFVDRPNVLNYRASPPIVNADREKSTSIVDIASNSVGVRPDAARNAFQVRLRQGVADTVAEMVAVGGDLQASGNTASVFARTTQADAGAFIRPNDVSAVRELGWAEDAAARLSMNLDGGYAAVALRQPVDIGGQPRTGWWRVDPATGETIGVMDTGFHTAQAEYTAEEMAINPLLNENWMAEIIRQEGERGLQEMTKYVLGFLVAKTIVVVAAIALWG